jgi:hypothetical protein
MSNPNGIGGYRPGQPAANPGGRPKSQSRVQLWFLKHALEAGGIIVDIARNKAAAKSDAIRLQACPRFSTAAWARRRKVSVCRSTAP